VPCGVSPWRSKVAPLGCVSMVAGELDLEERILGLWAGITGVPQALVEGDCCLTRLPLQVAYPSAFGPHPNGGEKRRADPPPPLVRGDEQIVQSRRPIAAAQMWAVVLRPAIPDVVSIIDGNGKIMVVTLGDPSEPLSCRFIGPATHLLQER